MVEVVRLRDPRALDAAPLQELMVKAFPEGQNLLPQGYVANPEMFKRIVEFDHLHLLVGAEKGEFKGLVLIVMPASAFIVEPQVGHFYNGGSAAMRDALIEKTVSTIVGKGYTTFRAQNMTDASDEAWMRIYKKAGKAEKIGSIFKFEIG